jgi:hypothetical protein
MTPQGDERGHDASNAAVYTEFVAKMALPERSAADFVSESNWTDEVQILEWARSTGVIVVGGPADDGGRSTLAG